MTFPSMLFVSSRETARRNIMMKLEKNVRYEIGKRKEVEFRLRLKVVLIEDNGIAAVAV